MKRIVFVPLFAVVLTLTACDQQKPSSKQATSRFDPSTAVPVGGSEANAATPQPKPSQVGRYVIVHSPIVERDTVLLDTVTGRTWELIQETDLNDEPLEWSPIARTDNEAEFSAVVAAHGFKKPQVKLLPTTP